MPERSLAGLTDRDIQQARRYEVGYDWIPNRFGPPPGIPRAKKEQLDKMPDREYLYAFMKLSQEQKESLMISEWERRRTFAAHWPIWNIVDGYECAKQGFYYTGVSDRVQCAFCGGVIRNWERGDVPKISHRNYFNYCKMVQGKPCHNIPYDENEIKSDIVSDKLSTWLDSEQFTRLNMNDLGILESKAKHPEYRMAARRMQTYETYSFGCAVAAVDLCAAGFYFEGPADKVKCFWCNGALELWTEGDDPWLEHAKWYPGCAYVRAQKGIDYIKAARAVMTPEDLETAKTLEYNQGDLSFLVEEAAAPVTEVDELETYKVCLSLGLTETKIRKAFELNNGQDFTEINDLITAVNALEDGDDEVLKTLSSRRPDAQLTNGSTELSTSQHHRPTGDATPLSEGITSSSSTVDLEKILKVADDPTNEESAVLVAATTCHVCNKNEVGAVLLPCGHFCICHSCSRIRLPVRCPQCFQMVKGACRALC